jgi:hypothetical protein
MRSLRGYALPCAWALALGCGGHEDIVTGGGDGGPPPVIVDAARLDGPAPDARVFADAAVSARGPVNVSLTAPTAGAVILGNRATVVCHAEANPTTSSPIVQVTIDITDGSGRRIEVASAGAISSTEWSATLAIDALQNGSAAVSCLAIAADTNASGATNVVLVDLGPRATVVQPIVGQAMHGNINVDFFVSPDPIATPDSGAAVVSVTAAIAGKTLTLTQPTPGHYQATVGASDTTIFDQPLDGPQTLRVVAIDQRGATRSVQVVFIVDNEPPAIRLVAPLQGDLVGGVITVTAEITDDNGVDRPSVVAVIGNGPDTLAAFALATSDGTTYTGQYDTKQLRAIVERMFGPNYQVVFPTISVRARDLPGNEGSVGYEVKMDYTPPLVSLNPPKLREARVNTNNGLLECSLAFDPLGLDSTTDAQAVTQLSEFRARIADRGNSGPSTSSVVVYAAGVDPATVQLFVLDNTDAAVGVGDALLVDTDGDGVCDDINPMLVPTTTPSMATDALALNLVPVLPQGKSFFDIDAAGYAGYPGCNPPANPDQTPPQALCPLSSGLQRTIASPLDKGPQIWGITATDHNSCLGLPFDQVANNIHDGWACVAVRAADRLGNVGISPPLRVCFDHDGNQSDGCPALPTYRSGIDVPGSDPVIPAGNPGAIDCTGTYYRATPNTPARTDPNLPCTLPPNFPAGEELRIDL